MTSRNPEPADVEALVTDLRRRYPDAVVESTAFPSGSVFVDVRRRGRAWVLIYSPTHGTFGVDELGEQDGFTTGYAYTSPRLDLAAQMLIDLVEGLVPSGRRSWRPPRRRS